MTYEKFTRTLLETLLTLIDNHADVNKEDTFVVDRREHFDYLLEKGLIILEGDNYVTTPEGNNVYLGMISYVRTEIDRLSFSHK